MKEQEIFLIDANSLITPHLTYYPFDFAPSFWAQIEEHIHTGRIVILDMVKNEILQGNDNLKSWMQNVTIGTEIDHRSEDILSGYAQVLAYIQNHPCYKPSALQEWAQASVADPWLIATAKTYGYTIVTFEDRVGNLSERYPSKNAKIPNVADAFGVKWTRLYDMMRTLGFHL